MPDDKIDSILRDGAGKQWDAEVIDAYLRARNDIRRIAGEQIDYVTFDTGDVELTRRLSFNQHR